MPIYNNDNKVLLSGISKGYYGNTLVYTNGWENIFSGERAFITSPISSEPEILDVDFGVLNADNYIFKISFGLHCWTSGTSGNSCTFTGGTNYLNPSSSDIFFNIFMVNYPNRWEGRTVTKHLFSNTSEDNKLIYAWLTHSDTSAQSTERARIEFKFDPSTKLFKVKLIGNELGVSDNNRLRLTINRIDQKVQ